MSSVFGNDNKRLFISFLVLMLFAISQLSCALLTASESEAPPGAEDGGQSQADSADTSDEENASDEEFEEIDLRPNFDCPEEPRQFFLEANLMMRVEEDDGFYTEHTKNDGVSNIIDFIFISKSGVSQEGEAIVPVVIEGESGDCTISGWGDIRFDVGGICRGDKAFLDITGEWELWTQTIECPGEAPVTDTDSLFPAPSADGEFFLSEAGDEFGASFGQGPFMMIYKWTLYPIEEGPAEPDMEPVPLDK